MSTLTPATLVHFYDTSLRRILCGLRGFEARSTKHAHGVTCPACIGLLGKRPPASPPELTIEGVA